MTPKNATKSAGTSSAVPAEVIRSLPPGSRLTRQSTTTVAPPAQSAPTVSSTMMGLPTPPPVPGQPLIGQPLAAHHFAPPVAPTVPQPVRAHRPTFDEPPAHVTLLREQAARLRRSLGAMLHTMEQHGPFVEQMLHAAREDEATARAFQAEGIDLEEAWDFMAGVQLLTKDYQPKEEPAAASEPEPAAESTTSTTDPV